MSVYLVRLRSNQELVGLFVSPDEESLWDFVDECTDPFVCEYIELSNGGLYLSDAGAPRVPTVERYPTEEEKIPDWFAGATLSELWIDAFYTDRAAWKSIEFPDDLVT